MNRFLSKSQIQKLNQAGIRNLYDFITMMPSSLEETTPLESSLANDGARQSWRAMLKTFEKKQGNKALYWLLEFEMNGKSISAFYFANSSFIQKSLIKEEIYDVVLVKKK